MAKRQYSIPNLTGQRFGKLLVIEFIECRRFPNKTARYWKCLCDCGNLTEVPTASLRSGNTSSCGCGRTWSKHNMCRLPEYAIWSVMKDRCLNPKNKRYSDYGGRGITLCERWKESFQNFFDDMGSRPSQDHTIERIDNNKGYSPDNCKWATMAVQNRNTRRTRLITFKGKTQCLKDWARQIGIDENTLRYRLRNWTTEDALTKPKDTNTARHLLYR